MLSEAARKCAACFLQEVNMNDKRTVGDYNVIAAMEIGPGEVLFCENPAAVLNERYLCCYSEYNGIFERYSDGYVSDDYAEIAELFGARIRDAAQKIIRENSERDEKLGDNSALGLDDCIPVKSDESLEGKVIVIKAEALRPEYRSASEQLMLCTGGFGAQPNARGRSCFCTSLYEGKNRTFYRSDILGTVPEDMLPAWAKEGLNKAKAELSRERVYEKASGDAR